MHRTTAEHAVNSLLPAHAMSSPATSDRRPESNPVAQPVGGMNDDARICQQHQQLRSLLLKEPALGALLFQGQSLADLATTEGLQLLRRSAQAQDYDAVAMNHGIRRLRLDGYDGEVVWDYPGNRATIVDSDEAIDALQANAAIIAGEVLAAIDVVDKFPDSDSLTNPKGLWSYRAFYDKSGVPNQALARACPTTASVIASLDPNLTLGFAFVSILDPQTTIAAHRGSTSLRQRYHLGIRIPDDGISRIRIGDTWKTWQEGKAFGFNDAIEHEVEHLSDHRRVVLIVDTWSSHVPVSVVRALRSHPDLLKLAVLAGRDASIAIND